VKEEYKGYIRENAENLASIGLRTLVLTQKIISEEFYAEWSKDYNEALTSMEDRKSKVQAVIKKLENNMDFLCVTGVEDLLQDEVDITIENLRNAGIKIWMLTGDKIETATCISISAGLKSKSQKIFFIRSDQENKNILRIKDDLEKYRFFEKNSHILIIDGDSLELALSNYEKDFFEIAMEAPAVVCCRCSPTQKSRIVKAMKKYANKKRTCAIGDGGNDVAMIQEADLGIGIVGKEGLQASLAADYSITKFKHLNLLLLWFGRISYKNTATISKFVMHRGLIISLIQFIFSIIFYCSAVPIYNGMLILGYSSVYTNFPVIALLLDRDTHLKNVMKFPDLYKKLLKGRELSIKSFLWWFWKSLFQASVIMIGSILLFGDSLFLKVATITFTCLILAELLNVYSEIKNFHKYMLFSLFGTLIVYLASLIFLKSLLDVYYIFDIKTLSKILLLTAVSWLPFYAYEKCRSYCYPEAHEKLNLIQENLDVTEYKEPPNKI
jgi:phospholipid-translocating ATPase